MIGLFIRHVTINNLASLGLITYILLVRNFETVKFNSPMSSDFEGQS